MLGAECGTPLHRVHRASRAHAPYCQQCTCPLGLSPASAISSSSSALRRSTCGSGERQENMR